MGVQFLPASVYLNLIHARWRRASSGGNGFIGLTKGAEKNTTEKNK